MRGRRLRGTVLCSQDEVERQLQGFMDFVAAVDKKIRASRTEAQTARVGKQIFGTWS